MKEFTTRRNFLKQSAIAAGGMGIASLSSLSSLADHHNSQPLFKISLAQWSLHKMLFAGKMDPLDFAKVTKKEFGISAVEYVNQFFKDKATDENYLGQLKKRAEDYGVKSLLIMCDGEGNLGDPDTAKRKKAVTNHHRWVYAAKFLGCHSIRVNAASSGEYEEQIKLAADGLSHLSDFAAGHGLNIIVENHGGLSSNGAWLAKVMKTVNMRNCGTLPDFGNFKVSNENWYDRYKGVTELMPYAIAVSAKSHDFNSLGNESKTDYYRMMKIVLNAGYRGYVGIEYEGSDLSESEGITATKNLLEKVRDVLS